MEHSTEDGLPGSFKNRPSESRQKRADMKRYGDSRLAQLTPTTNVPLVVSPASLLPLPTPRQIKRHASS